MKSLKSETIANVTITIAGVAATLVLVQLLWHSWHEPPYIPQRPPAVYTEGERLPGGLPFRIESSQRAVLVVVDSRCKFCASSVGFYRNLLAQRSSRVAVAVMGRQSESVLKEYVTKNGLHPDFVSAVPKDFFKSSLTPIIILTDPSGGVLRSWMGKLDDAGEKEVLELVAEQATSH